MNFPRIKQKLHEGGMTNEEIDEYMDHILDQNRPEDIKPKNPLAFSTTLLAAINAADLISVDGCETTCMQGLNPNDTNLFTLADESELVFFDQVVELEDGQTFFDNVDGEEHEIIFSIERRLQLGDLK